MSHFRFYRRKRIFPGLNLNLSRSGPSLSLGIRGAHVTVGRSGVSRTVGIPGSGVFWTSRAGHHTGVHSGHVEGPVSRRAQGAAGCLAGMLVGVVLLGALSCFGLLGAITFLVLAR